MKRVILDQSLVWTQVVEVAKEEALLELSLPAKARIEAANAIVRTVVEKNIRAYGVNTGVGALSNTVVAPAQQSALSRNILMSHAVGLGTPLSVSETRAIMVCAINNFAHGYSGLRLQLVERLVALLNARCTPLVPHQGSVGYISHMAHIGLVMIGHGDCRLGNERLTAGAALHRLGLEPFVLEAKEGLCLVNGSPCVTGLGCLLLERSGHLMDWADCISAMSFETQRCQIRAMHPAPMALRASPGQKYVAQRLNHWLEDSQILAAAAGRQTQDALSLRSIPHVHGAVRDVLDQVAVVIDQELASVTDNPVVCGTPQAPEIYSQAHAVSAGIGLAMDQLGIAMAQLGSISERRIDRMVNPLINHLPAFLAGESGVESGFMIAQYTAVSLVAHNRRLATPASLDGGVTSGLQEDILCHATPAALKAQLILDNLENVFAIELLAASQSYDLLNSALHPAPRTAALYQALRQEIAVYADDRPLGEDIARAASFIRCSNPERVVISTRNELKCG
ncbi:histidine ammonia-lyase [Pseudomonas sp. 10B1]|uniref:HAL/PAL/TAL family ammonia-lyase n=1 Tax=unclassified Pseudomonas TaxID=196821 RepID=UPI002AB55433|nr:MULTISPECIES: histidine ammonia-lyase [unclassified Pseudomonas]MDY7560971.1 histidine ammonia-lyase [Pseudomonas sp. AB6]MEA9995101.1 histidine ammonia-lyase [Pseudomonas sp. AA4]MEB0086950.1 histidine ammonia-lyase [Pseudomonas sp. RTI1]MEB0126783.1 histidine ammonia-lyase [Pseudomonas sp. CCC1.2]MEB0152434.1 histidine ammonia-lyase [Pseudomonas sp. CCC4.3]